MADFPTFGKKDVELAIARVVREFQVNDLRVHVEEYARGEHPGVLAYERTGTPSPFPVLVRYLLGAFMYVKQPVQFYDIFESNRALFIIQTLDAAILALRAVKAKGLDDRLERLKKAKTFDEFDSILFELAVARRYSEAEGVTDLEFIPENPGKKTPDLRMLLYGHETFAEAKKLARLPEHAVKTEAAVKALVGPALDTLKEEDISASLDVVFNVEPGEIDPEIFRQTALLAVARGSKRHKDQFKVAARILPALRNPLPTLQLYPSPGFFHDRYDFRLYSGWFGIVPRLEGKYSAPWGGASTWLAAIKWDAAVKWRFGPEAMIDRYRRFAFKTPADGIAQIAGVGINSTLHILIESTYFMAGRTDTLHAFAKHLEEKKAADVGWIVINELLFDVSPKGRNDLAENSHFIKGTSGVASAPVVSTVFTEGALLPTNPFGVGHALPDIDSVFEGRDQRKGR